MFKKLLCTVLVAVPIASLCFAGSEPDMKEGTWEITSKMEMKGMPVEMQQPMKYTRCLTKKDLVPKSSDASMKCKTTQVKTNGNTVTWVMQCQEEGTVMESSGTVTYSGDRFDGTIIMKADDPEEGKMNITQRISGRRIGDCK